MWFGIERQIKRVSSACYYQPNHGKISIGSYVGGFLLLCLVGCDRKSPIFVLYYAGDVDSHSSHIPRTNDINNLVVRRKAPRLSIAEASQSSWTAQAMIQRVDDPA